MTGEPLEEFLRLALQAELTYPHVHVVHATLVAEQGLAVCGLGGVLAEKRLLGMDSCSRPTAEYFLRPLWTARQSRKVLLLPAPPPGKLGGSEGEPLVAELIDSFHPNLCVVAGSSARRGSEPHRPHAGRQPRLPEGRLGGLAGLVGWRPTQGRFPRPAPAGDREAADFQGGDPVPCLFPLGEGREAGKRPHPLLAGGGEGRPARGRPSVGQRS